MQTATSIETHIFGPDSSPEQIEALRQCVSLYQGDIVVYRVIKTSNPFSVGVCFSRVEELVEAHGCRLMIVDARGAMRPDATLRKLIKERVEQLEGRILSIGIVASSNPLIKVAVRFLEAGVPVQLRAYDSIEEAAEAMRDAIR